MSRGDLPDSNPDSTQPRLPPEIADELREAGFGDATEVGRGGFGAVFRCVELSLNRVVAVKVLATALDDEWRARFFREQSIAGSFSSHPNIVQVLRVDTTPAGYPFLVMPFHVRGSLDRQIRDEGPLPWADVLSLGVKIASALATAHTAGVLHRDVNPSNILLTDYGEPQLADFGLARVAGAFRTAEGVVAGTPAYTAPEVLQGKPATAASDLYGLGATLFTALTGHAAFARKQNESLVAQFLRIGSDPVPDVRSSGMPPALCSAIEAAMERAPENRPTSVADFAAQLRNIQFANGLHVDVLVLKGRSGSRGTETTESFSEKPPPRRGAAATPVTRFRPPSSSHRLVDRPRLIRILREGGQRRLAFIHAPPGYGKTTLAAQWAAELKGEGIPVAWLTIVPDDNNVVWGLPRFVEAIRRVRPDLGGELAGIVEEGASDVARHVLATLIDEIHDAGKAVAIVVEDWHRIRGGEAYDAMRFVIENGCRHLRLIVTSRSSAGLPLADLRVRDELVEIGESALRFDYAEAEELLVDIGGLALDPADADRLRDTTEGWVAALQLASLSMRGKADPASGIGRISGHHRAIGEYLMENVVDDIEPELLEFMMRTAVIDTICADLAQALTGSPTAQDTLEEIHRRDLFLRSADDELHWFHYHSMFADFLRHRLARCHPGLTEQLHSAAADWFAGHSMTLEAVDHALAAGDLDRGLRLVLDHADDMLSDSRNSVFLALVAKLPPALAEADPRLQLAVAWAELGLFHPDAAGAARNRADAVLARLPSNIETDDLAIESEIVRVTQSLQSDRFDEVSPAAEHRLMQRPLRSFVADAGAVAVATTAFFHFDFERARRWHEYVVSNSVTDHPVVMALNDTIAAMAAFEQLDIDGAESILRRALEITLESGARSHTAKLIVSTQLAGLLYQTGQFAEADELAPDAADIDVANVEVLLTAYRTTAGLAAVRGDVTAAEHCLNEGHRVAHRLSLRRLAVQMLDERVRLGLPITHDERHRLTDLGGYHQQPDHIQAVTAELEQDAAVRLLLAERTPVASRSSIERSGKLFEQIRQQKRPRALLQAQLLYGSCLVAGGRTPESIDLLTPALSRCAELGLVRFAVDAGGPGLASIAETLHGAPDRSGLPSRQFLQRLLDDI
ncbi:serine/threonine-protein kinase [Nocardia sp. alder85J]|uniref:serine/threonine-protein kinase n=1 Tax=Nocardia sp. alder85J TaxID=2862949 RepID=UPI001CD749EE|nr:serine/threonine-protein kinase [Nocardia sp. alder85J]MCX4095689.1 protein kinase [Nocardia sp. alder85J]